jgi:hypothetical protein
MRRFRRARPTDRFRELIANDDQREARSAPAPARAGVPPRARRGSRDSSRHHEHEPDDHHHHAHRAGGARGFLKRVAECEQRPGARPGIGGPAQPADTPTDRPRRADRRSPLSPSTPASPSSAPAIIVVARGGDRACAGPHCLETSSFPAAPGCRERLPDRSTREALGGDPDDLKRLPRQADHRQTASSQRRTWTPEPVTEHRYSRRRAIVRPLNQPPQPGGVKLGSSFR